LSVVGFDSAYGSSAGLWREMIGCERFLPQRKAMLPLPGGEGRGEGNGDDRRPIARGLACGFPKRVGFARYFGSGFVNVPFPLTPALSPGERENVTTSSGILTTADFGPALGFSGDGVQLFKQSFIP
jgi:hypothetical protein